MTEEPETKKIKLDNNEPIIEKLNDTKTSQSEKDVGITEYLSKTLPIHGILKQRFSDFIVHEIAKDGTVIKLTNTDIPVIEQKQFDGSILEQDLKDKLSALNDGSTKDEVSINVDDYDKDKRKQLHCAIKAFYSKLDSNTVDKDNSKFIKVTLRSKMKNARSEWPSGRGKFVHFVFYKENRDTMEAINLIASKLRMNASCFGYAGTKDRRAKTSQVVSVKQITPEKLLGLNKTLRQMKIGNIQFSNNPLKLGDLKGNHFTIVLREVKSTEENINCAMKSLQSCGFINYFGMQRFGTSNIPTQQIGKALLESNWQEAIHLILKPRNNDDEKFGKCRKIWMETKDAEKALNALPKFKRNCIEGQLLNGIAKHKPNDLVNALNAIPRNTRLMYVHSYQSYIWNLLVSHRIKKYGLQPIQGDLVFDNDEDKSVKSITEENIASNRYTIEDVVLPLPGYDVQLPDNDLKQTLVDLLSNDGLTISSFRSRVKDYSLPGFYRKIIIKPEDVNWSFHKYNNSTEPLELSDLDLLDGHTLKSDPEDGQHEALKISLKLPSSCYATMALREVMKIDTSSKFQKTLNAT